MRAVSRVARAASPTASVRPRTSKPGVSQPVSPSLSRQDRRVYYHFRATRKNLKEGTFHSEAAAEEQKDAPKETTFHSPPAEPETPEAPDAVPPPCPASEATVAAEAAGAVSSAKVEEGTTETPAAAEEAVAPESVEVQTPVTTISPLRLKGLGPVQVGEEAEPTPAAKMSQSRAEALAAAAKAFEAAVLPISANADELRALLDQSSANPAATETQVTEGAEFVVDRAALGVKTDSLSKLHGSLGESGAEGPALQAVRECTERGQKLWVSRSGDDALRQLDVQDEALSRQVNSFLSFYDEMTRPNAPEISSLKQDVISENEHDIVQAQREVSLLQSERHEALVELEDLDRAWDLSNDLDNRLWKVCRAHIQRISKLEAHVVPATQVLSSEANQVLEATEQADQSWAAVQDSLQKDVGQLTRARAAADVELEGALEEAGKQRENLLGKLQKIEGEQTAVLAEIEKLQTRLGQLSNDHNETVSNLDSLQLHRQRVVDERSRFLQAADEHEVALAALTGKIETLRDGLGKVAEVVRDQDQARKGEASQYGEQISEFILRQSKDYWGTYCEFYHTCSELIAASEYELQENEEECAELKQGLEGCRN
eukprot:Hpha_TRINITY_DN12209_c0_g2::TRINITY_DN12209_c0_g2_i1::g.16955::m.16955